VINIAKRKPLNNLKPKKVIVFIFKIALQTKETPAKGMGFLVEDLSDSCRSSECLYKYKETKR